MRIEFAVIGGQKSGSTYIQSILAAHPQVFMPEGEIPYFEDPDYLEGGVQKLNELFKNQNSDLVWGIKRPNLLGSSQYASRLANEIGKAKLIVILRNPVVRLVSAYYHYMKDGFLPPLEFSKGIEKILNKDKSEYGRSPEVLEFGLYYKHLQEYFKYFSKDQILILLYDDLKNDKFKIIKKVYQFIGVDDSFNPNSVINKTPQKVIYSIKRQSFVRIANNLKYNYNSDRTRCHYKDQSFVEGVTCKLIKGIDKVILSNLFKNEKPKLNNQIHQKLYDYYKADIENLEKLINKDLTKWKYQSSKTLLVS
ncbi:sulfotransferase domain-containing protein [Porifericola rhodea]|uniref:sulfotransferase domain-containing protein n=1 Tax=Porifericola rhodea TaxID=930972 RepID=UPI0026652941|nr:sulfotransferase domain-containing protein [Porifericola rhodea]WKN32531.1 sulfotransferase domain-containing protein [Porifericola rhodea]